MLGEHFRDEEAFAAQSTDPATNPGDSTNPESAGIDLEKEWFLGIQGSMPLGPNSVSYEQTKNVYGPTALATNGSGSWRHHVEFNLWDNFGAITDERQAEFALLQAESDYKTVKGEVVLKLRDEFYSLQRNLIQIDSSIAKLRYQGKQIAILSYLMSTQETNASNYVDNLIAQTQDRYAFIQAVADYNVAMSSVGLLIGDPYYFENQRLISPEKYETSEITKTQIQ